MKKQTSSACFKSTGAAIRPNLDTVDLPPCQQSQPASPRSWKLPAITPWMSPSQQPATLSIADILCFKHTECLVVPVAHTCARYVREFSFRLSKDQLSLAHAQPVTSTQPGLQAGVGILLSFFRSLLCLQWIFLFYFY